MRLRAALALLLASAASSLRPAEPTLLRREPVGSSRLDIVPACDNRTTYVYDFRDYLAYGGKTTEETPTNRMLLVAGVAISCVLETPEGHHVFDLDVFNTSLIVADENGTRQESGPQDSQFALPFQFMRDTDGRVLSTFLAETENYEIANIKRSIAGRFQTKFKFDASAVRRVEETIERTVDALYANEEIRSSDPLAGRGISNLIFRSATPADSVEYPIESANVDSSNSLFSSDTATAIDRAGVIVRIEGMSTFAQTRISGTSRYERHIEDSAMQQDDRVGTVSDSDGAVAISLISRVPRNSAAPEQLLLPSGLTIRIDAPILNVAGTIVSGLHMHLPDDAVKNAELQSLREQVPDVEQAFVTIQSGAADAEQEELLVQNLRAQAVRDPSVPRTLCNHVMAVFNRRRGGSTAAKVDVDRVVNVVGYIIASTSHADSADLFASLYRFANTHATAETLKRLDIYANSITKPSAQLFAQVQQRADAHPGLFGSTSHFALASMAGYLTNAASNEFLAMVQSMATSGTVTPKIRAAAIAMLTNAASRFPVGFFQQFLSMNDTAARSTALLGIVKHLSFLTDGSTAQSILVSILRDANVDLADKTMILESIVNEMAIDPKGFTFRGVDSAIDRFAASVVRNPAYSSEARRIAQNYLAYKTTTFSNRIMHPFRTSPDLISLRARVMASNVSDDGSALRRRDVRWDDETAEFDAVRPLSDRREDMKTYPHHHSYLWAKRMGTSDIYMDVGVGGFAGLGPKICAEGDLKAAVFASAAVKATLFTKTFEIASATGYAYVNGTGAAGALVKFLNKVIYDKSIEVGDLEKEIPLVPTKTYTIFDVPIMKIPLGPFVMSFGLSATFDVSTKAVFTLQLQKPFSIQAKLYPSAGFTVAVDSSASFIGIFSGGIKVSARVAYLAMPRARGGSIDGSCKVCIDISHKMEPLTIKIDVWIKILFGLIKKTWNIATFEVPLMEERLLWQNCLDLCDRFEVPSVINPFQEKLTIDNPDVSNITVHWSAPEPRANTTLDYWKVCLHPSPEVNCVTVPASSPLTTTLQGVQYRKIYTVSFAGLGACGTGKTVEIPVTSSHCIHPETGETRNLPAPPKEFKQVEMDEKYRREASTIVVFSYNTPQSELDRVTSYVACISPFLNPSQRSWTNCVNSTLETVGSAWPTNIAEITQLFQADEPLNGTDVIENPVNAGGLRGRLGANSSYPVQMLSRNACGLSATASHIFVRTGFCVIPGKNEIERPSPGQISVTPVLGQTDAELKVNFVSTYRGKIPVEERAISWCYADRTETQISDFDELHWSCIDTGMAWKGKKGPYFKKIFELVTEATLKVPISRFLVVRVRSMTSCGWSDPAYTLTHTFADK